MKPQGLGLVGLLGGEPGEDGPERVSGLEAPAEVGWQLKARRFLAACLEWDESGCEEEDRDLHLTKVG
jgi:hypothetical protein